jgi:peptide/nickel transport system substrate-binding protein
MQLARRILASLTAVCAVAGMTAITAGTAQAASANHAHAKSASGGVVTFAEQPGSPPTYIFPLYNGANSGNNNITYLQPQMWLPLYWFGHPTNSAATINYKLSMAEPPVFSNGGKTITMKLKHYVWSTGAPVTARDVVFWMNLVLAEKTSYAGYVPGGWMTHVASSTAPSPTTFVLTLNKAYNQTYILYNGLATLTPMPQQAWDKTSTAGAVGTYDTTSAGAKAVYTYLNGRSLSLSSWDTTPLWQVVDGPWHLQPTTGFQVTGQVIMVPNKKYSGPNKAKISEFEELPFTTAAAEYNALRSGAVDYGYVPTTDLGTVTSLKSSGYRVVPWYEWGLTFVGILFTNPKYAALVNQLYIRQAMQTLIDQPEYIKSILGNYGTPTYGPVPTFPKTNFLAKAETKNPYPFSPKKAKKLLTSHGWTIHAGGTDVCKRPGTGATQCGKGIAAGAKLSISFMYPSGFPDIDNEIQVLRSAYSAAGIHLTLSEAPENTVLADAYGCIGKKPATCPTNTPALSIIASPVYTYVPIYYPDGTSLFGCGGATNGGNYCNKKVNQEITMIESEGNSASLKTLYSYQEYVAKQLPDLWFPNAAYQISAISTKLKGVPAQDSTAHIYPSTWTLKG